jgi:glycosyltransferase involved in cell wall biosynthesis
MKILFLSISGAVSNIRNRGIYPDLMRYFSEHGHEVFIVCPFERRISKKTNLKTENNVHILGVRTLNMTKSNFFEKGIATILIEFQFEKAINKYFKGISFDLILYSTPPISFNSLINKLKHKHKAKTYLMLKDIFPQNAVDLGFLRKNGIMYTYFRNKEKKLYEISDYIGCMSQANVEYLIKNNSYLNKDKIGICPNAIEIKERSVKDKKTIFSEYKIPFDRPVFLYGGNLGAPQGIEFLLDTLSEFLNREDCYFLIVGSGTKSNLIKNWVNLHNPSNVSHIPMLSREKYEKLEACCDVGMIFLDSRFTIPNFPSRLLAYLECKMPVIMATDASTDIGIIAEQNRFGLWSKSGDLDRIKENILNLISNAHLRVKMGISGFDYLSKNYQVSVAYNEIIQKLN